MKMAGAAASRKPRAGAPEKEKERFGRTGAVLIVCLMTLPFLVFFFAGRERASKVWHSASAKLTTISEGFTNASHASATSATKADELLGGLLLPSFDRNSCLSRYESHQYYRFSPYAPSTYLLRKLREYEARHKKCAPGTPLYAKAVSQLRSGRGTEAMECNYLVWLPYNGLGNRMLSLISTFVYALLTNRVVLLHSPADFDDLFCEPFPDTTWVLPPDFPVENLSQLGLSPDQSYRNLLDRKKMSNDPAKATVQSVPPYVFLNLGHEHKFMDKLFFCGDNQVVLDKVNWLLVFSDLYIVPTLYSMARFRDELRLMFPEKESVAHLLGRYLFHPTNSVWGLITRYYHSYLAQAEQIIGIQIRMFPFGTIPVDDMYNQILSCSRQEHILPTVEGDQTAETGNLTMNGTTSSGADSKSKAILIASLYADYYERLRLTYYEHAAKGGARVSVFQPSHEGVQATERRAHNQKALSEIYLLGFSDALLTSGMSTFGYVSSSLAGVRPTILLTAHRHKVPATPCVRAVSMEPCNLTPPRVRCTGYAEDKEDLAQHVKRCEDEPIGVKLFD
ncbi:hypothetical protein QOZ80_6AG0513420 [Eleusine coracana subsp. coracana]|nr:hypothetical protein QOZ80_6AG0513420 [Eleusine coracana subsp. coracana]